MDSIMHAAVNSTPKALLAAGKYIRTLPIV